MARELWIKRLVTWFGAGLSPKAPGTVGSLTALPFAWGIVTWGGLEALLVATVVVFALGCWASDEYMKLTGREDPSEVVIDEVAGMWLVLCLWPEEIGMVEFAAAFFAFRFFDIFKPWPVILADRKVTGGFGVMLDDLLAALYAGGAYYVYLGMYTYVNYGTLGYIP